MKYFFLLIWLCCFATSVLGQTSTTTLHGQVLDKAGQGIVGVNVFLEGTYDGTTTELDGSFSFATEEKGPAVLLFQYLGFEEQRQDLQLGVASPPSGFLITLLETGIDLSVAKVTAGRYGKTSDQYRTEVLNTLDILTTGGANADVVSALRTMPGTQQIGEQEGLFVRGGSGEETRIYVDGMTVTNFFYSGADNVAQRGRFNPSLFQGTFFSSGGFSAAYGQALSGSLNLESVDMPQKSQASAAINTVGAQAEFIKIFGGNQTAVAASVNYTNLKPYYGFIPQDREFSKMPEFFDASLNLRHRTSKTGMLKYFGQLGRNALAFRRNSLDYPQAKDFFSIQNQNVYSNLAYSDVVGEHWKLNAALAYANNQDELDRSFPMANEQEMEQDLGRGSHFYQARTTATWLGDHNQKIQLGAEYQYEEQLERSDSLHRTLEEQYAAAFIEGTFPAFKQFSVRIGLRAEHVTSLAQYNIAPRFALSYDLSARQPLSFAWGEYYQAPHLRFSAQSSTLDFMESTHYILSYQQNNPRRTFRAETFFKDYRKLIKTQPEVSSSGSGYARGVEVFWRDKKLVKNMDYWVSYSFLDTERDYLDFPKSAQPTFAADHTASVAVKKFFPTITTNLSATFSYATGRPYYNPNRSSADFLADRTKDYHNLSLTVAHLTTIGKAFTTLVLSVSNVLGSEQVFGYEYANTDPTRRRAITPTAPRFLYLGAFFNWGIDERNNTVDRFL